jgi:hypothetical protein
MGCESETTKESKSTSSGTQTVSLPDYVKDASQTAIGAAQDKVKAPVEGYTGDRVAGFSGDQTDAFAKLRSYLFGGQPDTTQESLGMARQAATAPAQSIGTERIVDQGGRLGAMADYTNPHEDAVVKRTVDDMLYASDVQHQGMKRAAGNKLNDARMGVIEASHAKDTNQNIGRAVEQMRQAGYDKAMAQRQADTSRMTDVDKTNASFAEQFLSRMKTGAADLSQLTAADQQRVLQGVEALLKQGGMQQANQQAELDTGFTEFLRKQGVSADNIKLLSSVLQHTPTEKTVNTTGQSTGTETSTTPDNSVMGALGGIVGKVASSTPVATALAAMLP